VAAGALQQEPPDVLLLGVAFARLSAGRVVARGTGRSVAFRRASGKVEVDGLDVRMAPGGAVPAELGELRVEAPRAAGFLTGRAGEAFGGVVVRSRRGDQVKTERLVVEGEEVRAPGRVEAEGPGYAIHGQSLAARADGTRVELSGGVSGRLGGEP